MSSNLPLTLSQILILTLSIIISQSLCAQENQKTEENQKIGILNPLIYDVKIPKKELKELNQIIRSEFQNQLQANQQLIDETISQTKKIFEQQSICQEECKIKLKSNKDLLIDEECQMKCEINIGKSINADLLITSRVFQIETDSNQKNSFYLSMIAFDLKSLLSLSTTKIEVDNIDQIQKSLKEAIQKFMVDVNAAFFKSQPQVSIPAIDVNSNSSANANEVKPIQDLSNLKNTSASEPKIHQSFYQESFLDKISSFIELIIGFGVIIGFGSILGICWLNFLNLCSNQKKNPKQRKKVPKKNINQSSQDQSSSISDGLYLYDNSDGHYDESDRHYGNDSDGHHGYHGGSDDCDSDGDGDGDSSGYCDSDGGYCDSDGGDWGGDSGWDSGGDSGGDGGGGDGGGD